MFALHRGSSSRFPRSHYPPPDFIPIATAHFFPIAGEGQGDYGDPMIGQSKAFRAVQAIIEKLAAFDAPVLIEGETGTGKELAARAIHYRGVRRNSPFVPVNCGALPDSLIENELFGHHRGAFTDARDDQPGLVALARAGTLFLDEIDALSPKGQVTLLRFLQDQQFRPL